MRDLSRSPRLLSVNGATVRKQGTLPEIIDAVASRGIGGIAPWRDQLQTTGLEDSARRIEGAGLVVTGVCRAGVFSTEGRDGFQKVLDENRRAVDEAEAVKAKCLILIGGGLPPGSRDLAGAHALVRDGLAALLPHARAAGVPLAIEPLHPMYAADRACINTLKHANDLCDELGDGLGVAVDVYHVWWDPALEREIARAGKRILGFHICDWLVPTTDMLLDRGMMGDGVIDIPRIRGWVEAAGYDGLCEAEIFSERNWWKRPMGEVLDTCLERFRTVC
jgi:sugar phosphate isomerase/epimerase